MVTEVPPLLMDSIFSSLGWSTSHVETVHTLGRVLRDAVELHQLLGSKRHGKYWRVELEMRDVRCSEETNFGWSSTVLLGDCVGGVEITIDQVVFRHPKMNLAKRSQCGGT